MNEELKIIISAETDKLKKEVEKGKEAVSKFGKDGKTSLKDFNDEMQKVGDISKGALAVLGGALVGVGAALFSLEASTREYREGQAKLATAFETAGGSAETAKKTYNDLYRVMGDSGTAVEAAGHLAKLTTNEQYLAEWTTICEGVYATFGDSLPIEGLTEAANETAKTGVVVGTLSDALNWAGVSEDAFNESLAACNTEAEREALIRETLNGLYNDAATNYETNNTALLAQNEAQSKLNDSMAAIGEAITPINTALTELAADILADLTPYIEDFAAEYLPQITDSLSGVGEKIGEVIKWITDNWELITTIGAIILGIAAAISVFSTIMGVVNAVMAASPVTWIVLGIVAALTVLVAIVILAIKYWDDIKEAVSTAVDSIKEFVGDMVDSVSEFFSDLWSDVSGCAEDIWDDVSGYFSDLWDDVSGYAEDIWDDVSTCFSDLWDDVSSSVEGIWNDVSGYFSDLWDDISGFASDVWDSITEVFDDIYDAICDPIEEAKETISGWVDEILDFFDFEWSIPKPKFPKFSVSGGEAPWGFLGQGSLPKISIDWNAAGGVFNKPTVFSYGNTLQGIGEAGAEAVVPLEKNLGWLDKLAGMLQERMGGNTPIVLTVDGKVFAQTSIDSINQLTRQTGSLGLNLV